MVNDRLWARMEHQASKALGKFKDDHDKKMVSATEIEIRAIKYIKDSIKEPYQSSKIKDDFNEIMSNLALPEDVQIMSLRFVQRKTHPEIAKELNLPYTTYYKKYRAILKYLSTVIKR